MQSSDASVKSNTSEPATNISPRYRHDPYSSQGRVFAPFESTHPASTRPSVISDGAPPPSAPLSPMTKLLQDPSFSVLDIETLPSLTPTAESTLKPGDDWVELCVGQLPYCFSARWLRAFLRYCVPETEVLRCVHHKKKGYRSGLCFVSLRDNGAAQKLIQTMDKSVLFQSATVNPDPSVPVGVESLTVLWARDEAAKVKLETVAASRVLAMDPRRKGDGLPLGCMTVSWSRHTQNKRRQIP